MKKEEEVLHPHTIRFPEDLYEWIKEESYRERRTFNSQVIHLLELGQEIVSSQKGKVSAPPHTS